MASTTAGPSPSKLNRGLKPPSRGTAGLPRRVRGDSSHAETLDPSLRIEQPPLRQTRRAAKTYLGFSRRVGEHCDDPEAVDSSKPVVILHDLNDLFDRAIDFIEWLSALFTDHIAKVSTVGKEL